MIERLLKRLFGPPRAAVSGQRPPLPWPKQGFRRVYLRGEVCLDVDNRVALVDVTESHHSMTCYRAEYNPIPQPGEVCE